MYQIYLYVNQLFNLTLHSMWKWIIHKVTGRCELLRIQYEEQPGAYRTIKTELSVDKSKLRECQALKEKRSEKSLSERIEDVMQAKKIVHEKHPIFRPRFTECMERMTGYSQLTDEIELLRTEKYEEGKHVNQLLDLWKVLKPDEPLEQRFTRQWGDIGFQGADPATDFRGMGLLGFENLRYFSTQHNEIARQTLLHSNHPKYGYSFAIVGINMTELCIRFFKNGALKSHFYNLDKKFPTMTDFHELYCYILIDFDKLWMSEKPNIMQFNEIRKKYEEQLTAELSKPNVKLCLTSEKSNLVVQEC